MRRMLVRGGCALICAVVALGGMNLAPWGALAFDENPLPYWVHVSRLAQIVTVHRTEDDSVVRQMICSTGLPGSPTVTGKFKMPKARSDERKNWYAFHAGGSTYAHYASRITGSYLFHSILYRGASTSSLRRDTWNLLGSKASAGCVRMTPLDAQWIAYHCAPGTLVVINDKRPDGPIRYVSEIKKTLPNPSSGGVLKGFEPTLSPTPKPGPQPVPTLSLGIEGPRTKSMQTSLRNLGHFDGSVNGTFGQKTLVALTAFQTLYLSKNPSAGLVADGTANEAWQEIIKENKSNAEYVGRGRTLKVGVSGLSVKALRERLKALRYTTAASGTGFDERTKKAVGAAQRAFGMKVNGIADAALQEALFAAEAKPLPYARAKIRTGLTLRTSARTGAASVIKVKDGTRLAVAKFDGDWSYVTTGSKYGFVLSRYLAYEDASEDPAAGA